MASLGHDLKTLRKKQNLDLDEIQEITRIPPSILASIEDDSIFDKIDSNTTYTRSYVRSYARAIGIKEARILLALDQVQASRYEGGLLNDTSKTPGEASADEHKKESPAQEDEASSGQDSAPSTKKIYPRSSKETSSKDWDWVNVGRKAGPASSKKTLTNRLLLFLILVLITTAGLWIYSRYWNDSPASNRSDESTRQVEKPPIPSDSLREALGDANAKPEAESAKESTREPATYQTLPDTLSLSIYAAGGKLEPVRVQTDLREKRNPYWVPEGDTISFNFVNTIQVRAVNQYERLQLIFNGHRVPNAYQAYFNPDAGAIEITRKMIEQHRDWW